MPQDKCQAHGHRRETLRGEVVERVEVAEAFAHLRAVHEQVFAVLDPATGVQLSFISRTGHRVPMGTHNVRTMFDAISDATPGT